MESLLLRWSETKCVSDKYLILVTDVYRSNKRKAPTSNREQLDLDSLPTQRCHQNHFWFDFSTRSYPLRKLFETTWFLSHRSSEEDSIRSNDGEFDQALIFQIARFWFIDFFVLSRHFWWISIILTEFLRYFWQFWPFLIVLARYEIEIVGFTRLSYTLKKVKIFQNKIQEFKFNHHVAVIQCQTVIVTKVIFEP